MKAFDVIEGELKNLESTITFVKDLTGQATVDTLTRSVNTIREQMKTLHAQSNVPPALRATPTTEPEKSDK